MYSTLGMYSDLILIFLFWLPTVPLFTRNVCIKVIYSSAFYEFSKRSSDIAYFVEHLVYSILYSLLILAFLFWFTTINSKNDSVKVIYFWNFRCSGKGAAFVEHPVCSSFKMYAVVILFFILFCNYFLKENV